MWQWRPAADLSSRIGGGTPPPLFRYAAEVFLSWELSGTRDLGKRFRREQNAQWEAGTTKMDQYAKPAFSVDDLESGRITINPDWLKEVWSKWPGGERVDRGIARSAGRRR